MGAKTKGGSRKAAAPVMAETPSRASAWIRRFNRNNKPERDQYSTTRMLDRSWWEAPRPEGDEPSVSDLLRECADLIDSGDDPYTAADVAAFLMEFRASWIPCVAWRFVETYHDRDSDGLSGACVTEEQAAAFLTAEQSFWVENKRNPHRRRNTWRLERAQCSPHDLFREDLSAEAFRKWLGQVHS